MSAPFPWPGREMFMKHPVIDIHVHIWPDELAGRAVKFLADQAGEKAYLDGTAGALEASMRQHGIQWCVTQPVSTRASQTPTINNYIMTMRQPGFIHFGTLHPQYPDYAAEIDRLRAGGIQGVKFHPDYQEFFVDDERMFPFYRRMAEAGLIAFFHAGVDIGLKPPYHGTPPRLARVLEAIPDLTVVAAHFGGFEMWDEVDQYLVGKNLYFDTSFTLSYLDHSRFVQMARRHGIEKILFGSDSPWADQGTELELHEKSGLTDTELAAVLHDNAAKLLNIA